MLAVLEATYLVLPDPRRPELVATERQVAAPVEGAGVGQDSRLFQGQLSSEERSRVPLPETAGLVAEPVAAVDVQAEEVAVVAGGLAAVAVEEGLASAADLVAVVAVRLVQW